MEFKLSHYWSQHQPLLFPKFDPEVSKTTDQHRRLIIILDTIQPDKYFFIPPYPTSAGRPSVDRRVMFSAFIAKSVLKLPSTKALIDRLITDPVLRRICGFDSRKKVPCEATFSNSFFEFAESQLPQSIHEALISEKYQEKLIGHISRDATAIEAREKPTKKEEKEKTKGKRGRPKKSEKRAEKEPKRIEKQLSMSLEDMLIDLPYVCDTGTKKNAKGYKVSWNGYKLHLDVADGDIPVSMIVTSASLHDSQAAIPLETMSQKRVTSLYSLMDAAYDSEVIKSFINSIGKIPVIDPNSRRGEKIPLDPAKQERYKERSAGERVNSRIKDDFGGRTIFVKGASKISAHLAVGVLAYTAEQLVRVFSG